MSLNAQIDLRLQANIQDQDGGFFGTGGQPLTGELTDGTSENQANIVYAKRRTIEDDLTPDTIDLNGGGLLGIDGEGIDFAEVVALLVRNLSDSETITVGGGSNAPAWLTETPIPPGGTVLLWAPADPAYEVVAGTGDIVQVTTGGGEDVPYYIQIIGRDA